MKAKEGPTEPGKPTEPSDAEPTEPSELDDDKMEAPHGQHGGRQNQHGLFATGASRSAGGRAAGHRWRHGTHRPAALLTGW
ncbi:MULTISPECIES: hypothetical protein [Bifidobacterium]|uniref:hypothetical protein n=1 Tax=Bifidobacterium TaxID=1678 RepID=UPI0022E88CB0|nr:MULTISPECIES: hypothetical protein [Bifidobacterium]MDB1249121.1 hypothetical protein [Bifidobacterium bifidum]MDB1251178.1 hypothetical protein [Bifidobacterium bifidum]